MLFPNEALTTAQQNELRDLHKPLVEPVVNQFVSKCPEILKRTDREDLMGEGFYGLALATRSFNPAKGTNLEKWAEICIRNAILTSLKPLGLHIDLESFDDIHAESTPDNADPATLAEARVLCNEILDQLSAGQRTALKLHFLDGKSKADIARRLNISRQAVGQLIERALNNARIIASGGKAVTDIKAI